jgi:integrase
MIVRQPLLFDGGESISLRDRDLQRWLDLALGEASELTPNTARALRRACRSYAMWCDERDVRPLPADPGVVLAYLREQASLGRSLSWLEQTLWGVSLADARARVTPERPHPVRVSEHEAIQSWLSSWRRKSHPQRRAPAITASQVRALVLSTMQVRQQTEWGRLVGARDRALLVIGVLAACRRSELSAFVHGDFLLAHEGLVVTFQRSKNDQGGIGAERVLLAQGDRVTCPVDAWRCWCAARGPVARDAPAFPASLGHHFLARPLAPSSIRKLVQERAAALGIELTTHSLRSTFATVSLEHGHDPADVAHHGRWRSRVSFERYVRRGRNWKRNPTSGLL